MHVLVLAQKIFALGLNYCAAQNFFLVQAKPLANGFCQESQRVKFWRCMFYAQRAEMKLESTPLFRQDPIESKILPR